MKQELKSGIKEFDEAVEQFENGEINFVELTSRLWNKAYSIGQSEQLQQTGVMACFSEEQLSQINKYGKHQHNRGAMDLPYVSFEFWLK